MNELDLPKTSEACIARLESVEAELGKLPQVTIPVEQKLYAGMYARTICVPKGVVAVGVTIEIPTILVLNGHCQFNSGDKVYEFNGHYVLEGQAHRKQICVALEDTYMTMMFPTSAKTVEEAEEEFTHEANKLQTRKQEVLK